MSQPIILIEPTTSAAISESFFNIDGTQVLTVIANGFAGVEKATIEIFDAAQNAWYATSLALNSSNNLFDFYQTAALFRVNKGVTASPVGVTLMQNRSGYAS
jgi:hypothetical protein